MADSYQSSAWDISDAATRRARSVVPPESSEVTRGVVLNTFLFISIVTVISSTLVGFGQVLSICIKFSSLDPEVLLQSRIYVQFYGILFCCGVILTELEWTETVRTFLLLQDWMTRGFLYAFVGVLAFDEEKSKVDKFLRVSGLTLICLGMVYVFMVSVCHIHHERE